MAPILLRALIIRLCRCNFELNFLSSTFFAAYDGAYETAGKLHADRCAIDCSPASVPPELNGSKSPLEAGLVPCTGHVSECAPQKAMQLEERLRRRLNIAREQHSVQVQSAVVGHSLSSGYPRPRRQPPNLRRRCQKRIPTDGLNIMTRKKNNENHRLRRAK